MIITVTLNPALDKTVVIPGFTAGRLNRITQPRLDPGGKGINVSKVIAGLGGKSLAMGILGGQTGEYIRTALDGMGIACDFVVSGEPTRTNLKIIDPVLLTNTDINEPGAPADADMLRELLRRLEARVSPGDTVVLAGKAPEGSDDRIFALWTVRLRERGAVVFLDADGELLRLGAQALPGAIKPNEEEFSHLTGRAFESIADIARAALNYTARGIGKVVVSLGAKGALFAMDSRVLFARGLEVPVRSTVGAGDAVMAALALGNERGEDWARTVRTAAAVGAAAVMTAGTEAVSLETVRELERCIVVEELLIA
jgi:1-phosphofructokinase